MRGSPPRVLLRPALLAALLVATAALLPLASAHAADFTVTTTDDASDALPGDGICATVDDLCSLRAAVDEANAFESADSISVPAGTYQLNGGPGDLLNQEGDLNVTYLSGPLVVSGAGPGETVVRGSGTDRVWGLFDDYYEGRVTLEGMTITGGAGVGQGGGVLAYMPVLMRDVDVVENVAESAYEMAQGGGVFAAAPATLVRVRLADNTARNLPPDGPDWVDPPQPQGGGLFTNDDADLTEVAISNNRVTNEWASTGSPQGGGYAANGPVTIRRSLIADNRVRSDFFGTYPQGGGLLAISSAWISDTTFDDNRLTGYLAGNAPTAHGDVGALADDEFSFPTQGAGIFAIFALWTSNVTITDNRITADYAEGAALLPLGAWTSASTILAGNNVGGTPEACAWWVRPPISRGGNIEQGSSCRLPDPSDMSDTDPLLGPLEDNGGPTQTRALLEGSPAIDAGSSDVCPAVDQRGIPRPQGVACDSGAFELAVPGEEPPEEESPVEKPPAQPQPDTAPVQQSGSPLVLSATNGRRVRTSFPCSRSVPFRKRSRLCRKVTLKPPARSSVNVLWGKRARVKGTLRTTGGAPAAGRRITVAVRSLTSTRWRTLAPLTTGRSGKWSHLMGAGRSRVVRYSSPGAAPIEVAVRVQAGAVLDVSRRFVTRGTRLRLRGRARGVPAATPVQLQVRRFQGRWRTVAASWTGRGGRFAFTTRAGRGRVYHRALVVAPPSASLDPGWSRRPVVVSGR